MNLSKLNNKLLDVMLTTSEIVPQMEVRVILDDNIAFDIDGVYVNNDSKGFFIGIQTSTPKYKNKTS